MVTRLWRYAVLLTLVFCGLESHAQSATEQKKDDLYLQLKSMVEARQFRFRAMSATSQGGRTVQLGTEYYLQLKKDSLSADLPYYGRSYAAAFPGTDQGNRFETKKFSYKSDSTDKKGWEIVIQTRDLPNANKIFISIGGGGYSTVQITSANRSPISYYGNIVPYNFR